MAIKELPETATLAPERYRFSRADFHAMVEAGVLPEDARVELLWGDIVVMAAINARHASTVKRLNAALSVGLVGRAIIGVQDPFAIGDDTQPQPDVLVAKPRADFYEADHPSPADLFLVIEVSDTSLRYDHDVKVPLYAAAGITEVWLVNLVDNVLETYRDPGPKGYRSLQRLSPGDHVSLLAFPDLSLPVADLLPQQS
jgi:Uma2 family endonuclease